MTGRFDVILHFRTGLDDNISHPLDSIFDPALIISIAQKETLR
jgi:hypothetical protein